jgi:Helix-turn-helix domain
MHQFPREANDRRKREVPCENRDDLPKLRRRRSGIASQPGTRWRPWPPRSGDTRVQSALCSRRQATGGVRPRVRRRPDCALCLIEREEISRGLSAKESCRVIALRLGRAPSTVCREVQRNGGSDRYRACSADRRAQRSSRRPKPAKLRQCPRLQAVVEAKLVLKWSPQQISRWLPGAYPIDVEMRISHETIYMALYVQAEVLCAKSYIERCAAAARCAGRRSRSPTARGRSPAWSSSASDPPRLTIERYRDTGRAAKQRAAAAAWIRVATIVKFST